MKVILLQELKGKGKKGDILEVNGGYAQNFLIPKKIAILADATAVNENKNAKTAADFHYEEQVNAYKELASKLKGKVLNFKAKIGENGKMFGSITKNEILNEIANLGINLDKKQIVDFDAIKSAGKYKIEIKFCKEVNVKIDVVVE